MKRFVRLLNHLRIAFEDTVSRSEWVRLILETLRTSEGVQYLSHWYWELVVELAIFQSLWQMHGITYNPQITAFLVEAQEWTKLECWIGTIWVLWPSETGGITEEDLGHLILLLSRQRPGLFKKLEEWMGRWSQRHDEDILQRICKQAQEAAQRDTP